MKKAVKPQFDPEVAHVVSVLIEANGENAGTYSVTRAWKHGIDDALLQEKCMRFRHYDDNHEVEVDRYGRFDYIVPKWMDAEFLAEDFTHARWVFAYGFKLEWPQSWYYEIRQLRGIERYLVIHILSAKSDKNQFMTGLRQQVINWFAQPQATRFRYPISEKQFTAVCQSYMCTKQRRVEYDLLSNKFYGIQSPQTKETNGIRVHA